MMLREREGPSAAAEQRRARSRAGGGLLGDLEEEEEGAGGEDDDAALDGLPPGGRLEFELAFARWRPERPAYDATVEGLRRAVDSRPGPLAVLLRLAAEVLYFEKRLEGTPPASAGTPGALHSRSVSTLLGDIASDAEAPKAAMLAAVWLRILDPENRPALGALLAPHEAAELRRTLGPSAYYFTLHNPTGAYRLALDRAPDRAVALWLQAIGNDERLERVAAGVPDTSQGGSGENWRNVRLNGEPLAYAGTLAFPPGGLLELDYVSTSLAPPEAAALSDAAFRALLEASRRAGEEPVEDDAEAAREAAFVAAADFGGQLRRFGGSRVPRAAGGANRRGSMTAGTGGERRASAAAFGGASTAVQRPATVGEETFSRAGHMCPYPSRFPPPAPPSRGYRYVDMLFSAAAAPLDGAATAGRGGGGQAATVRRGAAWGAADGDGASGTGAASRGSSPRSTPSPLPSLPPSRAGARPGSRPGSRPSANALLAALPRQRVPAEAEPATAPARRASAALRRASVEPVPGPAPLLAAAARLRRLRAEHTNDRRTWFTARQVRLLMDTFPAAVHKVEVLVTLFGRVVDLPNVWRECVAGEAGASGLVGSPRAAVPRVSSMRRSGSASWGGRSSAPSLPETGEEEDEGAEKGEEAAAAEPGEPAPAAEAAEEAAPGEGEAGTGAGPRRRRAGRPGPRHVRLAEGSDEDRPAAPPTPTPTPRALGRARAAVAALGRGRALATASGRGRGWGGPPAPLRAPRLRPPRRAQPAQPRRPRGGYVQLDLTAREDHLAARIVVESCFAETRDASAVRDAFYNGNGFMMPVSWSPTPPKRGIVALVYACPAAARLPRRRADLAARHTLSAAAGSLGAGTLRRAPSGSSSLHKKKGGKSFGGFRLY
eukprot:tig00001327_g8253.t1